LTEETIQQEDGDALLDRNRRRPQRVEHYEMAAYASARTMAERLGN
jgi:ferritin-like metal-binding protein YciE